MTNNPSKSPTGPCEWNVLISEFPPGPSLLVYTPVFFRRSGRTPTLGMSRCTPIRPDKISAGPSPPRPASPRAPPKRRPASQPFFPAAPPTAERTAQAQSRSSQSGLFACFSWPLLSEPPCFCASVADSGPAHNTSSGCFSQSERSVRGQLAASPADLLLGSVKTH